MVAAETRTQSGSGLDDPRGDVDGQVTGCSCRPLVLAAVDGGPDGEVESCRRDESRGHMPAGVGLSNNASTPSPVVSISLPQPRSISIRFLVLSSIVTTDSLVLDNGEAVPAENRVANEDGALVYVVDDQTRHAPGGEQLVEQHPARSINQQKLPLRLTQARVIDHNGE